MGLFINMKYANIKFNDIANGPGIRTSLFVSGCTHHCKGCFNEIAWDFNYGKDFTEETIEIILKSCEPNYISGLTLLGGEPMEIVNQKGLLKLVKEFKKKFPEKNIWCYTGYRYEEIIDTNNPVHCEITNEFLKHIDILVDGKFILEQKDITLKFRGSKNQRIIDVQKISTENEIVLWN